jgi:hypothetical protein
MTKVIKENPKIVLKKFLKGIGYSIGVTAIAYAAKFIAGLNFEPEWAFVPAIVMTLLQTAKKALEEYKAELDI